MNRYLISLYGRRLFECNEDEVCEFVSDATTDRVLQLEIGDTLVDEYGDTWERVA
jgi:hypothetical protein